MTMAMVAAAKALFYAAAVSAGSFGYSGVCPVSYRAEDDVLVCGDCSANSERAAADRTSPVEITVIKTESLFEHSITRVQALSIEIAPVGDAVAMCIEEAQKSGTNTTGYAFSIVIVNLSGKEIARIPKGVRASWSPDGKELAYIAGEAGGSCPDVRNGTAYIYDLQSGKSRKVLEGVYEIHWAQFDGNLYCQSDKTFQTVLKYDPHSGKVEDSPHKSVWFSPNGDYNVFVPCEDPLTLYDARTNTDITGRVSLYERRDLFACPKRWVGSSALAVESYPVWGLCDVAANTIKVTPGEPVAFSKDGQYLIIIKQASLDSKGLVSRVKVSDLKIVSRDELEALHRAGVQEKIRAGELLEIRPLPVETQTPPGQSTVPDSP